MTVIIEGLRYSHRHHIFKLNIFLGYRILKLLKIKPTTGLFFAFRPF